MSWTVARTGRPRLDRELLFDYVDGIGRCGRRQLVLNQRKAAATLGWHRATVGRALGELEQDGRLRRWKRRGPAGVLLLMGQEQVYRRRR